MSKTPEDKVRDWLSTDEAQRSPGAPRCQTCINPKAEEINDMLIFFAKERASGRTTVPWSTFIKNVILKDPDFTIKVKEVAVLRHARSCLGIEEAKG